MTAWTVQNRKKSILTFDVSEKSQSCIKLIIEDRNGSTHTRHSNVEISYMIKMSKENAKLVFFKFSITTLYNFTLAEKVYDKEISCYLTVNITQLTHNSNNKQIPQKRHFNPVF